MVGSCSNSKRSEFGVQGDWVGRCSVEFNCLRVPLERAPVMRVRVFSPLALQTRRPRRKINIGSRRQISAAARVHTADMSGLLECFVLVPAPHEPVVVRLDRNATIGQVKSALERKRGWPCAQQRLRLESGPYSRCDTNDAQSLVSLRLHKQALPTLQLHLLDERGASARPSMYMSRRMPSFGGARASEVQVEPNGHGPLDDERAALDIQRIARGKHARRQCENERLWIAVRAMCANTEARSAVRIQQQWRQSRAAVCAAREAREGDAAGAIQRVHRNRQRRLNPKRNQAAWLRGMLEQVSK